MSAAPTSENIDKPWRRHAKKLNFGNVSETCQTIFVAQFGETKMA